jgi:hypothetical protein
VPGWSPDPAGTSQQHPIAEANTSSAYSIADLRASIDNLFIWLLSLVPVISMAVFVYFNFFALKPPRGTSVLGEAGPAVGILGWILFLGSVALAYLDHRMLKRAGFDRPFHWAWSFLTGAVYVIGRSVIVKGRTDHGMLPAWISVGLLALALILAFVQVATSLASTLTTLPG